MMKKISIVVPVLNSHEIVRRQIIAFDRMNLPSDVEIIYVDDMSDPPIPFYELKNFTLIRRNDQRPWTWALARNDGARLAMGAYLLMTDLDYIIPKESIELALSFCGDYMGFRREFGILDEDGRFSQEKDALMRYGLPPERYAERGVKMPAHPNNFLIRKNLFWEMGGYRTDLIGKNYPQGEDNAWKQTRKRWQASGKLIEDSRRPLLYMFPNGRWCGDVDFNPFNLFHGLSRRSQKNPWVEKKADGTVGAL